MYLSRVIGRHMQATGSHTLVHQSRREVYIMEPDLSPRVGWETGRQSEPAFMDIVPNFQGPEIDSLRAASHVSSLGQGPVHKWGSENNTTVLIHD